VGLGYSGAHFSGLTGMVRCFHICGIAFAMLLAGAANAADRPNPAVEGCLGKEVHICERSFERVLQEIGAGENLDQQLKSGTTIRLTGFAPDIPGSFTFNAEIDKTNRVTAASIILPFILSTAPTTESGYTKSGLYEGVVILLGSSCVQSRDALYRLFEDKIKPTLKDKPDRSHTSDPYFEKAEAIPLCKHTLTYSVLFGTDTYHMTRKNPPGSFVFPVIAVE
jgi:hypothetical protein